MIHVWVGYHCYYNQCDVFRKVERVFDDEVKALLWSEDAEFNRTAARHGEEQIEWREYEERIVE
jgi:hypothetical protein